jgi:hypothetical protein
MPTPDGWPEDAVSLHVGLDLDVPVAAPPKMICDARYAACGPRMAWPKEWGSAPTVKAKITVEGHFTTESSPREDTEQTGE